MWSGSDRDFRQFFNSNAGTPSGPAALSESLLQAFSMSSFENSKSLSPESDVTEGWKKSGASLTVLSCLGELNTDWAFKALTVLAGSGLIFPLASLTKFHLISLLASCVGKECFGICFYVLKSFFSQLLPLLQLNLLEETSEHNRFPAAMLQLLWELWLAWKLKGYLRVVYLIFNYVVSHTKDEDYHQFS